jgi:DNA ligase-1
MQQFARLFADLDQTNKTNEKVTAMAEYFRNCDAASAAWAIYFLSGQKLKRLMPTTLLRAWAMELARIEPWLFEECYEAVGDLAETISLIVPKPIAVKQEHNFADWVTHRLIKLRSMSESEQRESIVDAWGQLDQVACLVFNKLITGSFRVGVSQKLVVRALSEVSGVPSEVLAHRLMGTWEPTPEFYASLVHPDAQDTLSSQPYPFFLAHALENQLDTLGDINNWQAEWKWDGIRAQVVRRSGQTFIWSRGEELMTERFPDLVEVADLLPDGTVIDGEIVGFRDGVILPFANLQRRIGRKQLGKKILTDVPVSFLAFDILEFDGIDLRTEQLLQRRVVLETVFKRLQIAEVNVALDTQREMPLLERADTTGSTQYSRYIAERFQLPPIVVADSWEVLAAHRQQSREMNAEGLMLKRLDSPYRVGRPRGDWWKWKIEPYTIDAVLIYAQRGHGRRASLYTDYTFAVWDEEALVPFAKAYSGLTDAEIRRVDSFVRRNTLEKFGPVRSVTPELVFELAFENIQLSKRHKSGIAVRFPRILRWREDKSIADADSLDTIRAMLMSKPAV